MEPFADIRLWILIALGLAWMLRTKRALTTLKLVPSVKNVSLEMSRKIFPKVSVLIPAKNEEDNIKACVEAFLAQSYPNLDIIVINDNSTDKTKEILSTFNDSIKVIDSPKTPEGWTGKNHALHCGVPHATGEWLLFTDADTRHDKNSVASAIHHVEKNNLSFLTLTPQCLTEGFIEKLIQPCAMGHTGLWFPLEKVNDPNSTEIFGNGQYLFIKKPLYQKIGGHQAVKGAFLEDFALVGKVKEIHARFQAGLGTEIYGTRMYTDLNSIWNGWRRIFLHAFDRKAKKIFSKFLGVIVFSILPFTSVIMLLNGDLTGTPGQGWVIGATVVLLAVICATAWKTYGIFKGNRLFVFLYPVACFFLAVILLDAWWMAFRKKKTSWR